MGQYSYIKILVSISDNILNPVWKLLRMLPLPSILFAVFKTNLEYHIIDTTTNLRRTMHSSNELRDFLLKFDYTTDYEVRYIPQERARSSTHAYLSDAQVGDLTQSVGDAGTVLMWHYLSKVTVPKYDFFDDKQVGDIIKWSWRKVQKARLDLMKAGWIKRIVYTQPTTKSKFTVVYLGKEMCSLVLTPEEYTMKHKQINDTRNALIKQFGCKDWDELIQVKSMDEISNAMDKVIYS